MSSNPNKPGHIVGNAFIACLLAGLSVAIILPIGLFLFNIPDGRKLDVFSYSFLYAYFLMTLSVAVYSLFLSSTLGLLTLLTFHHFRINFPTLLFFMGVFYVMLILVIFTGSFDVFKKSGLIWVFIFSGGLSGYIACHLFNKKCQQ